MAFLPVQMALEEGKSGADLKNLYKGGLYPSEMGSKSTPYITRTLYYTKYTIPSCLNACRSGESGSCQSSCREEGTFWMGDVVAHSHIHTLYIPVSQNDLSILLNDSRGG